MELNLQCHRFYYVYTNSTVQKFQDTQLFLEIVPETTGVTRGVELCYFSPPPPLKLGWCPLYPPILLKNLNKERVTTLCK